MFGPELIRINTLINELIKTARSAVSKNRAELGLFKFWKHDISTAQSVENETRNDHRNAHRNPEWWGEFVQLVEIAKLKFIGISRYKFKLRFWLNMNSSVSSSTNSNCDFSFAVD